MQRNICELKLNALSAIYRAVSRAFHIEHAIEDIIGVLSKTLATRVAAVLLRSGDLTCFVYASPDHANNGALAELRGLYKTQIDPVFHCALPFAVMRGSARPLFLDRAALDSIRKERVQVFGVPVILGKAGIGAITVDRLFGEKTPIEEDIAFLTVVAGLIAQIVDLERHARRREELLVRENLALRARISEERLGAACLGKSTAIRKVEETIRKVAQSNAPVLLWGEPGTGKAYIARIIHELSNRAARPFVTVHCSLPGKLLEHELFPGGAGSFPATPSPRPTKLEEAEGGTVFLEEVADLSIPHQIKLLEFLEQAESRRFGGPSGPKRADVRMIAATSADLAEAAASGSFRKDLLGKLNTFPIRVPPLRERREDIPLLIRYFLDRACREYGQRLRLGSQAMKRLSEYDWPGNLHEIRNATARLVIGAEGPEIGPEDLPPAFGATYAAEPCGQGHACLSRLDEIERKEVSGALERNRWIQRKAANELGLTFRQMNYRVKKFGLEKLIQENRAKARSRG